jgi:ribosomal protein L7/L12
MKNELFTVLRGLFVGLRSVRRESLEAAVNIIQEDTELDEMKIERLTKELEVVRGDHDRFVDLFSAVSDENKQLRENLANLREKTSDSLHINVRRKVLSSHKVRVIKAMRFKKTLEEAMDVVDSLVLHYHSHRSPDDWVNVGTFDFDQAHEVLFILEEGDTGISHNDIDITIVKR